MISCRYILVLSVLAVLEFPSLAQGGPEGDGHPGFAPDHQATLVEVSTTPVANNGDLNYVAGPLDQKVWEIESLVKGVRKAWIGAGKDGGTIRENIRISAMHDAQALASVPDRDLGLGGLIVKNEYACFGFVIAAANENTASAQLSLARKADAYCRAASVQLQTGTDPSSTDRNAKAVDQWATASAEQPRIDYLLAMSTCLQINGTGRGGSQQMPIETVINRIPTYYLERFPPSQDFVLSRCLNR